MNEVPVAGGPGSFARFLHWSMAAMIVGLYVLGAVVEEVPVGLGDGRRGHAFDRAELTAALAKQIHETARPRDGVVARGVGLRGHRPDFQPAGTARSRRNSSTSRSLPRRHVAAAARAAVRWASTIAAARSNTSAAS